MVTCWTNVSCVYIACGPSPDLEVSEDSCLAELVPLILSNELAKG